MNALQQFKDKMTKDLFGIDIEAVKAKGICLNCKEPALPKCYSEAGRREYKISGLCEKCFDEITS